MSQHDERQPLLAARHDAAPVGDHEPALERNFSFIAALGLAFTLLNTWTAM